MSSIAPSIYSLAFGVPFTMCHLTEHMRSSMGKAVPLRPDQLLGWLSTTRVAQDRDLKLILVDLSSNPSHRSMFVDYLNENSALRHSRTCIALN